MPVFVCLVTRTCFLCPRLRGSLFCPPFITTKSARSHRLQDGMQIITEQNHFFPIFALGFLEHYRFTSLKRIFCRLYFSMQPMHQLCSVPERENRAQKRGWPHVSVLLRCKCQGPCGSFGQSSSAPLSDSILPVVVTMETGECFPK